MSNSKYYGSKKKRKQGGRFQGDVWLQRHVEPRVLAALKQREREWLGEHEGNSNAKLIGYVRACANKLGRTPMPTDIIGGKYIQYRFGTWGKLLESAKLPPPTIRPSLRGTRLYAEEFQRQAAAFKQEHSEKIHQKRLAAEARRKEQEAAAAAAATTEAVNE